MMVFKGTAGAVFVAACAVFMLAISGCSKDDAPGGHGGPPAVVVMEIQPMEVKFTRELAGRVFPYQISEVRPQVNGILQKRLFEEGSDVKAGDILYKIDPAVYQANYDAAKAQLLRAEANVPVTQLKFRRNTNLVKENAVSRQELESSDAAHKQAMADVAVAKASLEATRINLNYTNVTSPISGRIGRSSVTPGALMSVGQPEAMVKVQQLDPVYVDVTQSSKEILRVRRSIESGRIRPPSSDAATLFLEDGTEYSKKGELQFVDVSVDQTTGSVTLRAIFPNPDHVLLPGMYARVVLDEGTDENAILVPQPALMRDARGNASVMVVNNKNIVEARQVKALRTYNDSWVIGEGLAKGERIIVEGLQFAQPDSPVTIKSVRNSAANANAPAGAKSSDAANKATDKAQVN